MNFERHIFMLGRMIESGIIKVLERLIGIVHGRGKIEPDRPGQILLGTVAHPYQPNKSEKAFLEAESRLRHIYVLGATGSGKSKLLESMIRQDILACHTGFALIDPHGDLSQNILSFVAQNFSHQGADELGRRLILIEPFNREYTVGFNPLEALQTFPAMHELLEVFRKYWSNGWGPRMEEVFRCTFITLAHHNLTMLEARPFLTNVEWRQRLAEQLPFQEVRDYWLYRYNPLSEKMQALYREPVLNKISAFVTDPAIYRILGQTQSTVNFRQAMDQGHWLLLNLSKGQLKENIRLLGTLFLAKIKQAALSRIDTPEDGRRPFFAYIDEFQNFIGEDLESMLSEARKFRLGLTMANQNLDQLPRELRSAILGNVSTEIFFRLSHHDASQVSSELDQKEKGLIEKRLIDLQVGQAYLKVKGQRPKLLKTLHVPSIPVSDEALDRVKRASFRYWAKPVAEVEREIEERRSLWQTGQAEVRSAPREPKARALADQELLTPEGSFEEGQNDW